MTARLTERHAAAIERLALRGEERVLEIGCGNGRLAAAIIERLTSGCYVGIDRSATALAAAAAHNAPAVEHGVAAFVHMPLEYAVPLGTFDRIVAVNVNLFWTGAPDAVAVAASLLRPEGVVHLVYALPPSQTWPRVLASLRDSLARADLAIVDAWSHAETHGVVAIRENIDATLTRPRPD